MNHTANDPKTTRHVYLEVFEFRIGDEPLYRALSYTWGPATDAQTEKHESDKISILLGGEEHDVTPNLFDAIVQMSESYNDSYFWIDALCINQDDLLERQVHVAMMDKIFHKAAEVIVWLGRAEDGGKEVVDLVQKVAGMDDSFFHKFGHATAAEELGAHGLQDSSEPVWGRYLEFYERRWFNRGWVIQEVVLGKKVIAHFGPFQISWNDLILGSRIFLPERLRKNFFASFRETEELDNLPLGRNAYRISLIYDACIEKNCKSLLIVGISTGTYALASAEHILLHLVRMSRDFVCEDPRDKIYALLGLVNKTAELHSHPRSALVPDYGKHVTEAMVLTAFAKAIIERSNYLGIIAQVSDPFYRNVPGLDSWVPTFVRCPNFATEYKCFFNVCKHRPGDMPFYRFDDSVLAVKGTKLGTLRQTVDLKHEDKIENFLAILKLACQSTFPLGQSRLEALWRTMVWDCYRPAHSADLHPAPDFLRPSFLGWVFSMFRDERNRRMKPQLGESFDIIKRILSPPGTKGDTLTLESMQAESSSEDSKTLPSQYEFTDPAAYNVHASGVTWSQQLFLLDNGYLGMGPKSGQAGDEVWIISGCPFPMVLRRHQKHRNSFFVVGRSYVHGVMHGEAVNDDSKWEEIKLGKGSTSNVTGRSMWESSLVIGLLSVLAIFLFWYLIVL